MRVFGLASSWIYTSVYMNDVLKIPLYYVGLIYTISGIFAASSQIYGGRLGDRFGYRRIILITFFLGTIIYGLLYLTTSSGNFPVFVSLLFISGQTLSSIQRPSSNALLAISSNKPLRSFSFLRVGANMGWGIGPAVGGFLVFFYGYPSVYLMAAVMSLASALFVLKLQDRKPSAIEKKAPKLSSLQLNFVILGICGLLLFMVQAQESVTLANYAFSVRNLNTSELGFIYMANGFAVLLFQGIAYRISSRISITSSFVMGALIYSFGYLTMSLDAVLPAFILSMALISLGEDFAFPMGNVIVAKLYGDRNTGFYMGIYNAFLSFGRSVGPVLGGVALAFLSSPFEIWLVVTLPGFMSAIFFYSKFSKVFTRPDANSS